MKEYHSFYFIAWLTRKRSRTNLCFVTAFRSYLPVQSGLGIQFVLAWIGLKQAGCVGFVFPAWVQFFVSGVTWSARRVALETLLAHVAWRHRGSSPLLWNRWVRYSVVLRLWHGLGLLWLVSLWESSGPASRSALRALERAVTSSGAPESCKREKSERAHSRVVLNCPSLDIAHIRLVQSERRYGAEPRPRLVFARHFHGEKNNFWFLY